MIYRKLKRAWSHNHANYIPGFKETFPELNNINSEELCNRFVKLKMEFYYEERTPVSFWVRLTLPFGMITILIMFIGLPINFLITGNWGYSLGEKSVILNWLKSLRLM